MSAGKRFMVIIFVEEINTCLERNVYKLKWETDNMDTSILHVPPLKDEQSFLPYVGNGFIGSAILDDASIRIKGRVHFQ